MNKSSCTVLIVIIIFVNSCICGFTETQKKGIVDAHNIARANAGITHGPKPISPLNNVTWDNNIENFVQGFVNQCKFGLPSTGEYGYSFFRVNNANFEPGPIITSSFNKAVPIYDWATLNCLPNTCCFMYPTIIWNASTSIGCATAWCNTYNFYVCGYNPMGGLVGVQPYKPNTPSPTITPKISSSPNTFPPTIQPTITSLPTTLPPTLPPTLQPSQSTGLGDINWVSKGFVTSIKDQGQCGSCWAFAGSALIESYYLMNKNNASGNIDVSEQHMVDCISNGCNGGNSGSVFTGLLSSGVMYEADYPYKGVTQSCPSINGRATLKWSSSSNVKNTKQDFINALQIGPIYASVYVDNGFQNYKDGVYSCSSAGQGTNHQIALVGYNSAEDSFLVKNSWGTWWGSSGYMRIKPGTCNMFTYSGGKVVF